MTLPMIHGGAQVVRAVLISLGLGTSHLESPLLAWPIYVSNEPAHPDNCITIYDTTGTEDTRDADGPLPTHEGIQVRVRGSQYDTALEKVAIIAKAFDGLYRLTATVGPAGYLVQAIHRKGSPHNLGKERSGSGKRRLFTLDAIITIERIN